MPKAITETLNIHEVVAKGRQRLDDVEARPTAAVAAISPNGEARTTAAVDGRLGGGGFAKVGHMAQQGPVQLTCELIHSRMQLLENTPAVPARRLRSATEAPWQVHLTGRCWPSSRFHSA